MARSMSVRVYVRGSRATPILPRSDRPESCAPSVGRTASSAPVAVPRLCGRAPRHAPAGHEGGRGSMGVAWVGPLYMVSGLGDTAASFPAGGGPGREVRNAPPGPATGRGWNEARGVGASPGRPCGIPGHGTVAERARRRAAAARTSPPHTCGRGISVGNTAGGEGVFERAPRRVTLPPGRSSTSPAAPRPTCRAPCCAVLFRAGPHCSLLSVSAVRAACASSGGAAAPAGRAMRRRGPGRNAACRVPPSLLPCPAHATGSRAPRTRPVRIVSFRRAHPGCLRYAARSPLRGERSRRLSRRGGDRSYLAE